jgi:hypothetical protein
MSHDPYAPIGQPLNASTSGRTPDVVIVDDPPAETPDSAPVAEPAAEPTSDAPAALTPEEELAAQLAALDALRESE